MANFAGSEILVLELYNYFKTKGDIVNILTNIYDEPIKSYFDDKDVFESEDNIDLNMFDFIWSQHCLLSKFFKDTSKNLKAKIVSVHLSPFNLFELSSVKKLNISNVLFIANSEETKDKIIDLGVSGEKIIINYNAAPSAFLNKKNSERKLKKIAIISNHPPLEIVEAKNKLSKKYKVDLIGLGNGNVVLVTRNLISNYDLIISIGKTVQYSLLSDIPIYCYDHFGGPGYLNNQNYKKAKYYNFSGRGFGKKNSKQITYEIINYFDDAVQFLKNFDDKTNFILESFMDDLLNKVKISEFNYEEKELVSSFIYHEKIISDQSKVISNQNKVISNQNKRKKLFNLSFVLNLIFIGLYFCIFIHYG